MGAAPLAFLMASILYACTGLSYAELAAAHPVAGGGAVYARKAFGNAASFISGWGLLLDYTIDISLFAVASIGYLGYLFPSFTHRSSSPSQSWALQFQFPSASQASLPLFS
jgi:APA family basic amino acid/polyamine antiporter